MSRNEKIKRFNRAIARHGLFSLGWFINKLPYFLVNMFMNTMITLGFMFTVRKKEVARENLKAAFGDQLENEKIDEIVKQCFSNLGKGMVELIYFMEHPSMIADRVVFEGKHHLDEALKEGNGVIAVSAHFGSFPILLLRLAQLKYSINAIIRSARDKIVEKRFQDQRTRMGLKTIYANPRKQCVHKSINVLRNNEILFIPLDQNFGSGGGVFVEFFGQKAATATGPVVFAKRTKAAILPMFVVRQKNDVHKVIIEPPMKLVQCDDEKEFIHTNTANITKIIEKYIRKYPHEWGWMHRRWKSKQAGDK